MTPSLRSLMRSVLSVKIHTIIMIIDLSIETYKVVPVSMNLMPMSRVNDAGVNSPAADHREFARRF